MTGGGYYREVGGGGEIGFRFLVPTGGRSCDDNYGGDGPAATSPCPVGRGGEGSSEGKKFAAARTGGNRPSLTLWSLLVMSDDRSDNGRDGGNDDRDNICENGGRGVGVSGGGRSLFYLLVTPLFLELTEE